jgi:excisionase family DNA binding protein
MLQSEIAGTSRREQVLNLRETGLSCAEIGRRFGITKQRVSQILKGNPSRQKPGLNSRVMLTTSDVAQLLGLHPNTVRRWSNLGILRSYHIGPGSDRRYRREDIDGFLRE